MLGKTHTEETRSKISAKVRAWLETNEHPQKGIPKTEEQKQKFRDNHADYKRGNHPQAKTVINKITLEEFKCSMDVCDVEGYKCSTFRSRLNGSLKNNTPYMYKEDYLKEDKND